MRVRPLILACTLQVLLLAPLAPASTAAAAPVKVAVFDFELYDTSLEGEMRGKDPNETARLQLLSKMLRDAVAANPQLQLVDTASLRKQIDAMPALYTCNGCETPLAEKLGADRSVFGYVYKVSTLILYITLAVRDVDSGKLIAERSVSIRGNTDLSWQRGLQALLKQPILIAGLK